MAVYAFFSFLIGPKGLTAYNQLQFENEKQMVNIEALKIINDELENVKNNLLYDQDTVLVHARRMGYGYENERFIRVVGLGNVKNTHKASGNVYFAQDPDFLSGKTIKIAALTAGLLIFAFLFMLEIIEKKTR